MQVSLVAVVIYFTTAFFMILFQKIITMIKVYFVVYQFDNGVKDKSKLFLMLTTL
jgi:hypothetical protein